MLHFYLVRSSWLITGRSLLTFFLLPQKESNKEKGDPKKCCLTRMLEHPRFFGLPSRKLTL
jgi:hypothetical protein